MADDDEVDFHFELEWFYIEDDYPLAVSQLPLQFQIACSLPCTRRSG
jgi:hypothetical protein